MFPKYQIGDVKWIFFNSTQHKVTKYLVWEESKEKYLLLKEAINSRKSDENGAQNPIWQPGPGQFSIEIKFGISASMVSV